MEQNPSKHESDSDDEIPRRPNKRSRYSKAHTSVGDPVDSEPLTKGPWALPTTSKYSLRPRRVQSKLSEEDETSSSETNQQSKPQPLSSVTSMQRPEWPKNDRMTKALSTYKTSVLANGTEEEREMAEFAKRVINPGKRVNANRWVSNTSLRHRFDTHLDKDGWLPSSTWGNGRKTAADFGLPELFFRAVDRETAKLQPTEDVDYLFEEANVEASSPSPGQIDTEERSPIPLLLSRKRTLASLAAEDSSLAPLAESSTKQTPQAKDLAQPTAPSANPVDLGQANRTSTKPEVFDEDIAITFQKRPHQGDLCDPSERPERQASVTLNVNKNGPPSRQVTGVKPHDAFLPKHTAPGPVVEKSQVAGPLGTGLNYQFKQYNPVSNWQSRNQRAIPQQGKQTQIPSQQIPSQQHGAQQHNPQRQPPQQQPQASAVQSRIAPVPASRNLPPATAHVQFNPNIDANTRARYSWLLSYMAALLESLPSAPAVPGFKTRLREIVRRCVDTASDVPIDEWLAFAAHVTANAPAARNTNSNPAEGVVKSIITSMFVYDRANLSGIMRITNALVRNGDMRGLMRIHADLLCRVAMMDRGHTQPVQGTAAPPAPPAPQGGAPKK